MIFSDNFTVIVTVKDTDLLCITNLIFKLSHTSTLGPYQYLKIVLVVFTFFTFLFLVNKFYFYNKNNK